MTDKPKLKACLDMSWKKLRGELCKEIRGALGEKGPWKHARNVRDHCPRCGREITDRGMVTTEWNAPCPVPPPITDPVEVVAERLTQACGHGPRFNIAIGKLNPGIHHSEMLLWFLFEATPTQRIITCLLALGKIPNSKLGLPYRGRNSGSNSAKKSERPWERRGRGNMKCGPIEIGTQT